ncbi:MAG: NADH:ubiquinone reductase (Na(+)-transporting) subunit F [Bacteroidales bacterium]|nr:NADH:ubiquinone reductase (Na(+)-transporting) subunit F [Bacteroidales bacterium]
MLLFQSIVLVSAIAVFLVVMVALVAILLFAKKKLTSQSKVKITINDKDTLEVDTGNSLMLTLKEHDIHLPSACGGGGSCGMCKCRVVEGGNGILPTETGFFTRKEQQNFWRLACQVKVRNDMKLVIPEDIMGIKKMECEVVSNRNVATFIKEFVVKLPEGETLNFKSGSYIQIDVPQVTVDYSKDIEVEDEFKEDWDKLGIWNLKMTNPEPTFRAYSMANHPAESNVVMLNIRIATPPWDRSAGTFMNVTPGVCSSFLFSRKPGDKVMISGPYGEFHLKDTDREIMFIGGGAGMAPMRSHIFHLFKTLKTTRKVSFWYGARSRREIFYENDFKQIEAEFSNFSFNIALSEPKSEDNWDGYVGFIHKVIEDNYLKNHQEPEEIEYYLCGPPMMTAAVTKMLDDYGVPEEMIAFDDFGG